MKKQKRQKPKKEKKTLKSRIAWIKKHFIDILIFSCVVLGWYVLTFSVSADLINKIYNQNSIIAYNNTMVSYSDEDIEKMTQKMTNYNESIYEEQQTTTFHYRGPNATDDTYKSLPTASDTIGTVTIPSINVNISISHGTSESVLQSNAGHVYGTSLPIDGENVHAVIAAHSALSSAKLFTDLNKLEEGDTFYVTVLQTQYEYKVDQIEIVLPEDDYQYEQIEEGKNYVTLYTCTPYGVNTHRLLVRGELVGSKHVEGSDEGWNLGQYLGIIKYGTLLALIIFAPAIVLLLYIWHLKRKNKKGKNGKSDKTFKKSKKNGKKTEIITEKTDLNDDFISIDDDIGDFLEIDDSDEFSSQ